MCNFCQASSVYSNACHNNANWRVQSICRECNGNFRIIVTNDCGCRRLYCNAYPYYQNNGETNTTGTTNGNGCYYGCFTATQVGGTQNATGTTNGNGCGYGYNGCSATRFACAQNAVTAQDGDAYYERLYGLNSYGNRRSCCCGGNTAL